MKALVSICCASGRLARYERVDTASVRLTHEAIPEGWGPGYEWDVRDIETMRTQPPTGFAVTETPWRADPDDAA